MQFIAMHSLVVIILVPAFRGEMCVGRLVGRFVCSFVRLCRSIHTICFVAAGGVDPGEERVFIRNLKIL